MNPDEYIPLIYKFCHGMSLRDPATDIEWVISKCDDKDLQLLIQLRQIKVERMPPLPLPAYNISSWDWSAIVRNRINQEDLDAMFNMINLRLKWLERKQTNRIDLIET